MCRSDLSELAEIVAKWADEAPGIPAVYLFGSRVRGDHRPDSDVDIRLYFGQCVFDNETTAWWARQNDTEFAKFKSSLPGPLAIHRELGDAADEAIMAAKANPVLVVRKVVCVWTPPRT